MRYLKIYWFRDNFYLEFPPNLESLCLEDVDFKEAVILPPNLKKLKIEYCNPDIFDLIDLPKCLQRFKIVMNKIFKKKNRTFFRNKYSVFK